MDSNDDFGNDCDFCGEPDRQTCGCDGERLRARCERLLGLCQEMARRAVTEHQDENGTRVGCSICKSGWWASGPPDHDSDCPVRLLEAEVPKT